MATYISNLMGDEIWDIKKEQVDNYEMQRKKKVIGKTVNTPMEYIIIQGYSFRKQAVRI